MPIKVNITGIAEVNKLIDDAQKSIQAQIPKALRNVESEMYKSLQKHIEEDWYEKYTPEEYKRRTDNPSAGPALGDASNMQSSIEATMLNFAYEPSGWHQVRGWSNRNGDELIESIQLGEPLGKNVPPRPFWNNFVEEMENGGIFTAFSQGMLPYEVIYDSSDTLDLSDSMLREGADQSAIDDDFM